MYRNRVLRIFCLIFIFSSFLFSSGVHPLLNDDSHLSDLAFKRKYIKQWNSIEGLIEAYGNAEDVYDKMFLVERLCFFLDDAKVFDFIISELSSELFLSVNVNLFWKLRASLFRLLAENKEKLDNDQKLMVLKQAKAFFRKDKSSRVVVSSAFALVRLSALDLSEASSSHRLFKRRTIAYLFSDRLLGIKEASYSAEDDYLVWGITMASLELGDSFVCYALEELRKKRLATRVLAFIDKALNKLGG